MNGKATFSFFFYVPYSGSEQLVTIDSYLIGEFLISIIDKTVDLIKKNLPWIVSQAQSYSVKFQFRIKNVV